MKVGDIVKVKQNERIPADMILLYTTEKSGSVFIKTDQLDGETDWKLRKAISITQSFHPIENLIKLDGFILANPPNDLIYDFKGYFQQGKEESSMNFGEETQREPLSLENSLWANTVLASSGYILGMVVYTGKETRSQMNGREPNTKFGKLDLELNRLSKVN